jgi:hypothetical protein
MKYFTTIRRVTLFSLFSIVVIFTNLTFKIEVLKSCTFFMQLDVFASRENLLIHQAYDINKILVIVVFVSFYIVLQ